MITRRSVISAGLAAAAMPFARAAWAQAYPERVIRMLVPASAGGQTDVLARFLAQRIQGPLGQSIIIDDRPGAGGATAARAAAAAEPDGYTLFFGNTSVLAVIPAVSRSPGYDPIKNFAPVASVSESYTILVVHPDFPARTVPEFVAYAKAHPGKLNFGNAGAGNVTHLTGEMFKAAAKLDFVNVPHKGGMESVTSLLGRQGVDFVFESPVILLPLIADKKLRALGVTSAARKAELPDVPTMREGGADMVATLLSGVVAPAGTPPAIVAKLNGVINDGLKTPEMTATLAKFGSVPRISSPEDFSAFMAAESRKWGEVAKAAGVVVD